MTQAGADDKPQTPISNPDGPTALPPETAQFLGALFDPKDLVLVRFIETWTEGGKKRSRTVYRATRYWQAGWLLKATCHWPFILQTAAAQQANVFFGVCPRLGDGGRFDLAWQVRTARVLWADLDHCAFAEALARCEAAGLPRPSVIVCSGNGVHLYWILAEPYLIDDAGDPPPVVTQFLDRGPGQKKVPFKVVCLPDDTQVRLYLRDPKTSGDSAVLDPECGWGKLSDKALRLQDILAGVAARIGGDHTSDLARLLRLPGTLNRKDERNGQTPMPCELVECDATRRYPLADFERFAEVSSARARREKVGKIRLPVPRKATPTKQDRMNALINVCATAEDRSRADWSLVCWAIEHGIDREELWCQVAEVGKFAQRGRPYFDRTWENAQDHARERIFVRLERRHGAAAKPHRNGAAMGGASPPVPPTPDDPPGDDAPPPGGGDEGPDGQDDPDGPAPCETLTDPHRLARAWLRRHARHHRPGDTVAFYRQQYWRWEGTHWRVVPDHEMKARVNAFVRQTIAEDFEALAGDGDDLPPVTRELVSNVLAAIEGQVLVPQTVPQPSWRGEAPGPRNWVAVANGLLDVDAFLAGRPAVLRAHSPEWFSPACLPYPFDPTADCPTWRAFLARNLGDDPGKPHLLQQWAGYLLLPDVTQQRFLTMVGEGANGKSVVCEVLVALLGEDNVSTEPLELFGDKFRLVNTLGKLANITAEVGELDRMAEGHLKAFVVGDPMTFEQKFKQPFTARPTARLMLATNNAPRFTDKSDGVWRRQILLPFVVQIPEEERVAGMDKREFWQRSGELPGILNWALAGLNDLRHEGRFSVPASCRAAAEELRMESNPARLFLTERYQAGDGSVLKGALYREYREWCADRGYHALADRGFGKEVKRAFRSVRDGKSLNLSTGKRENSYDGLSPRDE
jgi:P4 family phage/plasmid primase-like protien